MISQEIKSMAIFSVLITPKRDNSFCIISEIKNVLILGTKIPAGSANNLNMSGVPHLYMIGQSMMCGIPIIYLIMIITIYMIFIIWQVLNRYKYVWLPRSMTMLRTL